MKKGVNSECRPRQLQFTTLYWNTNSWSSSLQCCFMKSHLLFVVVVIIAFGFGFLPFSVVDSGVLILNKPGSGIELYGMAYNKN